MTGIIKTWILSTIIFIGFSPNIYASTIQIQTHLTLDKGYKINARADIIKWRYKKINGILHRRLYNYTHNQWIGEWEKV